MRFSEMSAATMANVKDDNPVTVDSKQNPIAMRPAAVEKLAHVERKFRILRRERAAMGNFGKRVHRFSQILKPAQAPVACFLRKQPFQNGV